MLFFLKSNHFIAGINYSFFSTRFLLLIMLLAASCTGQDNKDAADFFLKGNRAFKEKNYAEALRMYNEAIAKNADFSDAYLNKGICLMKLNKINEAHEVLTDAIQIDPTLVQAILVRSEAGLLSGKLNEAEEDLKNISKEYKDSSRYYLLYGNLMEARNRIPESMAAYDQAILLDKSNVEALVNRGAIYYRSKDYQHANTDFTRAIKVNPSQPEALNNLGLIAEKNRNWKEAIAYFDLILNTDPSNALALNNKGHALLQSGQADEAQKLIQRSLDIRPVNGYALRNLGIYYQLTGQTNKALLEFEKAIALAEPVEDLYGLTGKAYFATGNKASACKIWKQGMILKDSISVGESAKNCK